MTRPTHLVRLSSKGQIVIPAAFRRRLGLKTGQPLAVRIEGRGAIVFTATLGETKELQSMLRRAREWVERSGRDLVEELHQRRQVERRRELAKRGRRGD